MFSPIRKSAHRSFLLCSVRLQLQHTPRGLTTYV
nr:MAG TPA: hypothetical protein [Caudoviricetes sp.]